MKNTDFKKVALTLLLGLVTAALAFLYNAQAGLQKEVTALQAQEVASPSATLEPTIAPTATPLPTVFKPVVKPVVSVAPTLDR